MKRIRLRTDDLVKRMTSSDEIVLSQGQVEQVQKIAFEMAKDVISCCERRNVQYTLGGGTCLGAVRHQGFIPWDDDIDLNVSREGYGRLMDELEHAHGDKYWFLRPGGDVRTGFASTMLEKKGTRVRTIADVDGEHCGLRIDIFVIENAFNNAFLRKLHGVLCMAMGLFLSCRRYYELRDEILPGLEDGTDVKASIQMKVRIGRLLSFASLGTWVRWTDYIYSLCKDKDSDYVVIPTGRRHYFEETYKRSAFFPAKEASFQGMTWKVPADVDGYLTELYGSNYMTPPPPEDRERHIVYEFDLGEYGSR